MGLEILIGNKPLDVGGVKLNLTFNNPLFDDKNADRSYSYSFTLNATPNNKALLNHAERLDTTVVEDKFNCTIVINSVLRLEGSLLIKKRANNAYKCYWTNEATEFNKESSNVKLSELSFDPIRASTPKLTFIFRYFQRYEAPVDDGLGNREFSIKLNNKKYGFNISAPDDLQNAFTQLKTDIEADYPGITQYGFNLTQTPLSGGGTQNAETHLLMIEIPSPVRENILEELIWVNDGTGFTVGIPHLYYHDVLGDFDVSSSVHYPGLGLSDTMSYNYIDVLNEFQNNLTGLDNFLKTNPESRELCFPPIKNKGFFQEKNSEYKGYVNYYPYVYQNTQTDEKEYEHTFVPMFFLDYVLNQIEEEFNVSFRFNDGLDRLIKKLIFYSNHSIDDNYSDLLPEATADVISFLNSISEFVYPKNHIPDITISELIKAIEDVAGVKKIVEGNTVRFFSIHDILKSKVENWTEKSTEDYEFEFINLKGFKIEYVRDDTDSKQEFAQLDGYQFKEGEMEITPSISIVKTLTETDEIDTDRNWLLPDVDQQGISKTMGQSPSGNKPKFLIYHGHQLDSQGNVYPFASNHYLDVSGNKVGEFSLLINGTDGIYEQNWKDWFAFMHQAKPITKVIRLAAHEISNLIKWDQPIKEIYHNKGTMKGIVKSVQFVVDVNGISQSKVDFVGEGSGLNIIN